MIKSFVIYVKESNQNDWPKFNIKNKLSAQDFVNSNLYRLLGLFSDDYESISDEDKEKILINYFTENPDAITNVSFKTFGSIKNYIPMMTNIGGNGIIKYL